MLSSFNSTQQASQTKLEHRKENPRSSVCLVRCNKASQNSTPICHQNLNQPVHFVQQYEVAQHLLSSLLAFRVFTIVGIRHHQSAFAVRISLVHNRKFLENLIVSGISNLEKFGFTVASLTLLS